MKLKWICGLLFATVLAIPASAQIAVYIGHPPPRLRYERRGPGPGSGYAWVGGYWAPQGAAISGFQGDGTVRPMKAHIGRVPAMNTSGKAGSCVKVTGTATIADRDTTTTTITNPPCVHGLFQGRVQKRPCACGAFGRRDFRDFRDFYRG